jgi:hypothetical protein
VSASPELLILVAVTAVEFIVPPVMATASAFWLAIVSISCTGFPAASPTHTLLSAKLATSSPCVRLPLAGTADAVVELESTVDFLVDKFNTGIEEIFGRGIENPANIKRSNNYQATQDFILQKLNEVSLQNTNGNKPTEPITDFKVLP